MTLETSDPVIEGGRSAALTGKIIGITIIVACLALAGVLFKKAAIQYVTFPEAMASTDSTVQIIGAPVAGTMFYDENGHVLHFTLGDSGNTMPVIYRGPKPDDLDTAMQKATKITAQGTYSASMNAFVAENLLVKCPSKYQGTQDRSYNSSG